MDKKFLKDATEYLNRLNRTNNIDSLKNGSDDVLFLPDGIDIMVLSDSNVILQGLGDGIDNISRDLLRIIKIKNALEIEYEETNLLVPSSYAHSLKEKPWHITTQGFLTTWYTKELGEYIKEESKRLSNYYGKHEMDFLWIPGSKPLNEMKENEPICIFNRRVIGWDGSIERPVIELLGAGGHLQSVWSEKEQTFKSRTICDNLAKEFNEEIGLELSENEIKNIGGFINSKTNELVILANIVLHPKNIKNIQSYALGNYEEDTDGIYLGSFYEVMDSYKKDATFFAGGVETAKTNFPNNDEIMNRLKKTLTLNMHF